MVSDVLREGRRSHHDVDRVFTLRQARQSYPEPITHCLVFACWEVKRGAIEHIILWNVGDEERRFRANYAFALDFLPVDRNLPAEVVVGQESIYLVINELARYLLVLPRFGDDKYIIHNGEEELRISGH